MLLLTCISPALGYSHFVRWVLSARQLNWTTGILNAKEIIHRNELSQVLKERKTEQQPGRKAYNCTIKECKGWRLRIWTDQHSSLFLIVGLTGSPGWPGTLCPSASAFRAQGS